MGCSYGPLSKSDEKLRAEKNNTGDPPAAGLYMLVPTFSKCRQMERMSNSSPGKVHKTFDCHQFPYRTRRLGKSIVIK